MLRANGSLKAAIGEIIIKYSGTLERYAGDGEMRYAIGALTKVA
jgi:hypothetical protein